MESQQCKRDRSTLRPQEGDVKEKNTKRGRALTKEGAYAKAVDGLSGGIKNLSPAEQSQWASQFLDPGSAMRRLQALGPAGTWQLNLLTRARTPTKVQIHCKAFLFHLCRPQDLVVAAKSTRARSYQCGDAQLQNAI